LERVLVTGGGGFIGSNLVRALLREGYAVRVIENFATGRRENLQNVLDDVELIDDPPGILDPGACERAAAGVRAQRFIATPDFYKACRFCAFASICPYTATGDPDFEDA